MPPIKCSKVHKKKCKVISKDFSLKREYFEKNNAAGKRCLVKTTIYRYKFPSLSRLTFNHLKPWLKENQIHIQLADTDRSCKMSLIFSRILNIKSMGSWRVTPSFQEKNNQSWLRNLCWLIFCWSGEVRILEMRVKWTLYGERYK